ncbi:unnamed protein product [Parnassius mnemosyne]|uniref:Lipase domain-containing protein n=1 Tax=Parnassius mnemosyne TaxID=213953 RepID=A0AAV1M0D7_9NEOP
MYLIRATYENETKNGYGNKWLLFVDEKFNTHVMNFTAIPDKGMRFGKPYFNLYTRNNRNDPELLSITANNSKINSTYFNEINDIKVLTHGWLSDDKTNWLQNIKDSLLAYYDVNVITVDWGELAKNPIYPWSAISTRYVGKQIAKLLDAFTKSYGVQSNRMHLIGHSLGAHVVGNAGMFMKSKVRRITGLDPARPMFEIPLLPPDFRLDKSDANFVDIIHTCGGLFGYRDSHGHADFYPNEGTAAQPDCGGEQKLIVSCSHGRSVVYFEESIEYVFGKGFMAYPCENWARFTKGLCKENKTSMGYSAATNITGDYFLYTNNASKYAIEDNC